MLHLTPLEPRLAPALYASAGGLLHAIDPATGTVTRTVRPFEEQAAAVPLFVGGDDYAVYVGAGVGGGPRLSRLDPRTLDTVWSVFVGDPTTRTGVSVAAWQRRASLAFDTGWPAGQEYIDAIPPLPGVDLSAIRVDVRTPDTFDGGPGVSAYFHPEGPGAGVIVIRDTSPAAIVHELGHAIDWITDGVFAATAGEREAFAEAFDRWARFGERNPYFDSLTRGAT